LKEVMDDAVVADDELRQDYLAGVLASARSESGRDDRAATHAPLVGDLSTYALRTHYLLYASVQRQAGTWDPTALRSDSFQRREHYIPFRQYVAGMAFSVAELQNFVPILTDSMSTLLQRGLLGGYNFGSPEYLREKHGTKAYPEQGMVFTITQFGILFFAAACGVQDDVYDAWVRDPGQFALESGPALPIATCVADLPESQPAPRSD
jgi:hypothetical protein